MTENSKNKVFCAVRRCLDKCFGVADPLVQAVDYLEGLHSDPRWSRQEADEVESMVLRAVRIIVRQPPRACCDKPAQSSRR